MALQSQLFRGDTKLEAAAVSDPAHILPGAKGPHVGKIQFALTELDDADITQDSIYGPETAAAVLSYKQKRNIINRSFQAKADNIVGKMTIASLDREMFAAENLTSEPIKIRALNPGPSSAAPGALVRRANLLFAVKLDLDLPNFPPTGPLQKIRLEPRTTGTLEIENGKNGFVRCDNAKQQAGAFASQEALGARISQIFNPADQRDSNASQRLVPEPKDVTVETTFGGRIRLTKDPQVVTIDAFRPGDAFIDASNGTSSNLLIVEVRAPKLLSFPGLQTKPLTETRDKSNFLSKEGPDPSLPGGFSGGRPVNPKPGGRKINLGGEGETPGFENYTADLDFSGFRNGFNPLFVFRPWTEDPIVGVKNGEAGNICIRGIPISDTNLKEIRRIAAPGCRLTFAGEDKSFNILKNAFPAGKIIEEFQKDGELVIQI
jgi:hypothetical protein